ncbi:MAG: cytochrome c biogenesis protein [Microcystaceae cyanobacterium]
MNQLRSLLLFFLSLFIGFWVLFIPLNSFNSSSLHSLQTLAVQLDGRKKPLDTVAREQVIAIHGKLDYKATDSNQLDYLNTYLSLWFNNRDWNEEPFILVNYRPLKEAIGINPTDKYFTFVELMESSLDSMILTAKEKKETKQPLTQIEEESLIVENRLALLLEIVGKDDLPIVPHPNDIKGTWVSLPDANQSYDPSQILSLETTYLTLKNNYQIQPNNFAYIEQLSQQLQTQLRQLSPQVYPTPQTLQREVNFYQFKPFRKSWILYGIAFIVLLISLLIYQPLYLTSLSIFAISLITQSWGIWQRMEIANRPPVTNMYESVIWVGFGIGMIAFFFELFSKAKYYLLAAAPLSVICLILADRLPAVLDPSIKPLVPVLRDNFWLSIHVPTITLSYASFTLAFGLGHILLFYYGFKPQQKELIRRLSQWNYAVLQVGVLLLTTGIILGGIWAHFSWGRFWGWDPKETWALIALMGYIVPLHGRLVGWLGNFGLAVTSVVSFNGILMAWYGVNFVLGTGLHSYGFGTGGSTIIISGLVMLDLLFVLLIWLYQWQDNPLLNTETLSKE